MYLEYIIPQIVADLKKKILFDFRRRGMGGAKAWFSESGSQAFWPSFINLFKGPGIERGTRQREEVGR
jgi:hypothetical protein